MLEAALIINNFNQIIYEHLPPGRSVAYIPDSPALWDVIKEHKNEISIIAHIHPWIGKASPSGIDISTFRAIELGLGKLLKWAIITFDDVCVCEWDKSTKEYNISEILVIEDNKIWINRLRVLSGITT